MKLSSKKSQPIFDRAMNVMVKGVSSNFRFLGKNSTPVIARGKGAHIWDADGNKFIDYRLGWGPIILGHANDRVSKEVGKYLENGTSFAATTELEVIVAEKLVKMIPGMERLRFTNTGTEATMHALRTARGYTNKEKFINTIKRSQGKFNQRGFLTDKNFALSNRIFIPGVMAYNYNPSRQTIIKAITNNSRKIINFLLSSGFH